MSDKKKKQFNAGPYADTSDINTVPLTMHTALQDAVFDASASRFRVYDKPVHFVRVIGVAASMRDVSSRQTICYVSDASGTIAAMFSNESDDEGDAGRTRANRIKEEDEDVLVTAKRSAFKPMEAAAVPEAQRHMEPGVYYELVGYLTWLRKKRGMPGSHTHLCVTRCRRVTDMNQVTHHFLDAIHTHLLITRGPLPSGEPTSPPSSVEFEFEERKSGEVLDDDFF